MLDLQLAIIKALSGNKYVVTYDGDTREITTVQIGAQPTDTTITEAELKFSNGELVYDGCYEGDRHRIFMSTDYPFATVDVTDDDPTCAFLPPGTSGFPTYLAYQVKFKNTEGQIVQANIFDQTTFAEGRVIEYKQLKPSGEPVRIECIDNDEDKFTSIKAKQCIIEFNSSRQHDLNLFSEGEDNRWYVEALVAYQIVFKGFLVLSDLQEDFLCPPNIVSLTATDNVGLLKTASLQNFDGDDPIVIRPKVPYRWIDYLGWALARTGLRLALNICHNLREENNPTLPFWDACFLDAKTFEKEIGESLNAYDVIEMLLQEECFVTQYEGEWWVQRVDEIDGRTRVTYRVEPDLSSYSIVATPADKTIKKSLDIKWINRSAYVGLERPFSSVKETFTYAYPKEIIDNIDFSRGDLYTPLSMPPNHTYYHIDDWVFLKNLDAPTSSLDGIAFIDRTIEDGYEKERWATISRSGAGFLFIKSNNLPVNKGDKLAFSVDVSHNTDIGGSGFYRTNVAQIRLTGDDGSFWVLAGKTTVNSRMNWWVSNSTFALNGRFFVAEGDLSEDLKQWKSVTGAGDTSEPIPTNGTIEIILIHTLTTPTEIRFQNLRFEYIPFINGSYQKYNGQYWKVSQGDEYKATRDETVSISESPKRLFKGSLLRFIAPDKYVLVGDFFDPTITPTSTTVTITKTLIEIRAKVGVAGANNDYQYGGWYVFLSTSDGVTEGYYLLGGTEKKKKRNSSDWATNPALDPPPTTLSMIGLTYIGVDTASVQAYIFGGNSNEGYQEIARPNQLTISGIVVDQNKPYSWFRTQAVWNQYRRVMRIFDGELLGLTGDDLPDLLHRYSLSDPSPHTRNRYFMCLHDEMSLKLCRWKAYFTEMYKTDEPKVYDDTTEFKYIESR